MEYWKKKDLLEGLEEELKKYCDKQGYEQKTFDEQFQIKIIQNDFKDLSISEVINVFTSHYFFIRLDDSRAWHNPFAFYIIDQKKKHEILIVFENKEKMCWEIKYPDKRTK